jgi:tetratricopeptide (TPR) repeat protein
MEMARQGNRRAWLLGVLLLAIGGLAVSRLWPTPEPPHATTATHEADYRTPAVDAFMAQVMVASKIADPLERCLRMPDPPGSHWHAAAVDAYCHHRTATLLDATRFRALIAEGKGGEVDRLFEGYLQTQMHDRALAGIFDQAMFRAGFHDANEKTRKAIDDWKHQRPDSVFAVAASGMQYQAAAFAARGADSASKTSEAQWQGAQDQAALARRDLDRAATMEPAVPIIYATMLSNGVLTSDHPYVMSAIQRGLALQPNNLTLRLSQAAMTGEKWGGSTEWVARQASDAEVAAADTPLLWVAVGRARIEAATEGGMRPPKDGRFLALADEVATGADFGKLANEASRAHHYDQAYILAVEALRFDNDQGEALYVIGSAASHDAYRAWGKAELIRAAQEHPESVEVAANAGVWLRYLGEPALAGPLMAYAADRGHDTWVLSTLGDYYAHEGKDYAKASAIAEELIQRDPDDADGYVIRSCVQMNTGHPDRYRTLNAFLDRFGNDPEQQRPAGQIRAWLKAHPQATS